MLGVFFSGFWALLMIIWIMLIILVFFLMLFWVVILVNGWILCCFFRLVIIGYVIVWIWLLIIIFLISLCGWGLIFWLVMVGYCVVVWIISCLMGCWKVLIKIFGCGMWRWVKNFWMIRLKLVWVFLIFWGKIIVLVGMLWMFLLRMCRWRYCSGMWCWILCIIFGILVKSRVLWVVYFVFMVWVFGLVFGVIYIVYFIVCFVCIIIGYKIESNIVVL